MVCRRRADGIHVAAALFTNLTQDHLDYHGSMEEYYRAKRELFYWATGPKLANAGDTYGRRLAGEVPGVHTFGIVEFAALSVAVIRLVMQHPIVRAAGPAALTILALPPILINAYVGLRDVDPDAVEAATGMGMSRSQILWKIRVPLAAALP